MRRIDSTAWEEVLGVGRRELPWALQAQLRRIEDLHADVSRMRASLSDAPDEELVLGFPQPAAASPPRATGSRRRCPTPGSRHEERHAPGLVGRPRVRT